MERDFLLPDVGEGLEEATIAEWHVSEGDMVRLNQPLVSIETAKAAVELPSPYEGRVVLLNARPGDSLEVGQLLARIDTTEATAAGPAPAAAQVAPAAPAAPAAAQAAPAARAEHAPSATAGSGPVLVGYGVRGDRRPLRRRDWARPDAAGTRPDAPHRAESAPPASAPPASAPASWRPAPGRPLAKPPVRWLAKTLGVRLDEVASSGPRGEVTREDVRAAAASRTGVPDPVQPAGRPATPGTPGSRALPATPGTAAVEVIPVRGIRARIADRMTRSRSTIPEATCGLWVDCERLLELRAALRDAGDIDAGPLTTFALMAWMVPYALRASPLLNATYDGSERAIRVWRAVHLGIATSTPQGLLVAVVRDAHARDLATFAGELARLVRSAREGTLTPAELTGSTFTVSNYGALGLDEGNPIINAPECAILGMGAIRPRAAVWDGSLAVRSTAKLTCAFDHRVCDGEEAAAFLQRLKTTIEHPELLLIDRRWPGGSALSAGT